MNIINNNDFLRDLHIDECSLLIMYLAIRKCNIKDCIERLKERKLISELSSIDVLIDLPLTRDIVGKALTESSKKAISNEEEIKEIALALKELYPAGKKPGTTYMWRGNTAEIEKKLKTLISKYDFSFTKEQAIEATKKYISSFNGDYTKMRLLKYFILKTERDADGNTGISSDLMSFIENEDQEKETNDWTTTLV